ncbi:glutamate receptor 2.7-like [Carex rostrata]
METPNTLMFLLFAIIISVVTAQNSNRNIPVGVILDLDTLVGKMARTSMAMAVEDFYTVHWNYSTRLMLYTRDSNQDNVQATLAALDLLQKNKTEVIIGPQKSSQAVTVSEIGNTSHVPIISFSATSPTLSSINFPYFIRTCINDAAQVKTITSLIEAHGWREVVLIYEDTDFGRGILPFLADALEEINVRIPYRSLISKFSTDDQIKQELYKLQTMQTRVFIVHMSSSFGSNLFLKAKEVGMMGEGYVWIMTDGVTNMVYSLNESVTSAMKGALGVRLYVPKTEELKNITTRWKTRFHEDNPQEMSNEPSIYALWAYDTIYALAMAVEEVQVQNTKLDNSTDPQMLPVFPNGPLLLEAITNVKFRGLSGNFELTNGQLQYSSFEIVNIVGRGIREVGYWTEEQGLSRKVDESNNKSYYSTSLGDLNPVIWPGETIVVPRGWEIPVSGTKLRVGVTMSPNPEFMKFEIDPETNATRASGYSVEVFEAAVKRLPYAVPFEYEHFGGTSERSSLTYNEFIYQVFLGKYDIVIGDTTIRYNRTSYADFSTPYTESGIAMIVRLKQAENKNPFVFLQPLSFDLWLGSFAFLIYAGITILILEPKIREPLKNSISEHVGTILQLSLFASQEKLESILSKIVAIVSIFVLLILTSSYTASLSSMLTVKQLQPTVTDIYDLKKNGDYIGYNIGSFVEGLLEQLGFERTKIKGYYHEEYAEALDKGSANGGVTAIVHEIPYIKLFLAKNCKSYTMVGPIYKTAGFGFAFPKGSPLVADISRAILNITDGDEIIQLEKKWIGDSNCPSSGSITEESNSLNFLSFWGLFLITGVVSTTCLLIYAIMSFCKNRQKNTNVMSPKTSTDENTEALATMHQEEDQVDDAVAISPAPESDINTSIANANMIS